MNAGTTTWAGLNPLVRPVFVPSLVYATGASALVPAQILLALQMGFTSAGVAGVMTWVGVFAIASSMIAGRLVDQLGERRALSMVTVAGGLALLVAALCAVMELPGSRWVLVAALTVFDLVDGVWSIARQGIVADLAPAGMRGRAMNLYGACQRVGRVAGPVVAAGVMVFAGPAAVFPVAALIVGAALVLLLWVSPSSTGSAAGENPPPGEVRDSGARNSRVELVAEPQAPWRWCHRMLLLGIGMLILTALRTAKETLLPLWAAQGIRLEDGQVALALALASGAELALFWPAGIALDRYGRAPVVVTAMVLMSAGLCLAPCGLSPIWFLACAALIGLGNGVGAGIIKVLGVDVAPVAGRAAFLGRWQAIASAGSLLAPAVAGVGIAVVSLPAALLLMGAVGFAGSAWMAWWTPKLTPRPDQVGRIPTA